MLKKVKYEVGEDALLYEYHKLLDNLVVIEDKMNAADWMWLPSEWNTFRIQLVNLRKHIANIKKTLSED